MKVNEIMVSSDDAEVLSALIKSDNFSDAAALLAEDFQLANVVQPARLPANVVGMNSTVRYCELPDGETRTIVVVHPTSANAQAGRFSVLSPVGRALLGRKTSSVVQVQLPSGNTMRVKILAVMRGAGDG